MAQTELVINVKAWTFQPGLWLLARLCRRRLISEATAYRWALRCIWIKAGRSPWQHPHGARGYF